MTQNKLKGLAYKLTSPYGKSQEILKKSFFSFRQSNTYKQ